MDTAPAIPADVAAMFTTAGAPVIDAASAAGISPPPGIVPLMPPQALAPQALAPAPVAVPVSAPVSAEPAPGLQAGAAAPAVPAATVLPGPAVTWLGAKPRRQMVALDYPFSLDGVEWREIPCERMTGAELDAFFELPAESRRYLPTVKAPAAVLDALDADDLEKVREVALDFLPLLLRTAAGSSPDPSASSSDTFAGT